MIDVIKDNINVVKDLHNNVLSHTDTGKAVKKIALKFLIYMNW